jgi:exodeoxyribonuclease V alpha subunit
MITSMPTAVPSASLEVVIERITYANEETGYTVARVAAIQSGDDLLTVVGSLLGVQPGERVQLWGRWKAHPQYGRQFEVQSYRTMLPATIQGIRRYLGSGLIKGIGPKMAERIVDYFGIETLRIIEEEPVRLGEVPGLGPKRTALIGHAWAAQKAIKEVMLFLQGVGVSTALAVRIYKTYKDASISIVRHEPYRLAADVWGIGFKTADKIAQAMDIPHDSPARVRAGLQFALATAGDDGHCYLPEDELITRAAELLGVPRHLVETCLADLAGEEGVILEYLPNRDGGTVTAAYLVPFYRAEISLAGGLQRLLHAPGDHLAAFQRVNWEAAFTWLQHTTGSTLAPAQAEAVRLALTQKVAVLTGGPGCGKSFTVRAIVALARVKRARIVLAAPTGRAAKRLSELAGMEAATLHRLLQLRPGGEAAFDRDHPLDADLVIVDEASMLDVLLANTLVKAVASGAHLLFVGDVDQLPSVGAGEVLRDLLEAPLLPRVRLTQIFRQAQDSGVVTNAHRINAGQFPRTAGMGDFFLFAEEDNERVADMVVDIVANRLPRKFALDPRRDVQVLCPMHRGPAGAALLNERLQDALTPARAGLPERRVGGRVYRVGDKVTQIRNNYDKGINGVFNGSVGVVTSLSLDDQELRVCMDEEEEIAYDFDELDELSHAYAISIHRSQGSEYPCVVVPLATSSWLMLQRNLLYTAVTRAKRIVVLVGSKRALAKAVRTEGAGRRYTALAERLQRQATYGRQAETPLRRVAEQGAEGAWSERAQ